MRAGGHFPSVGPHFPPVALTSHRLRRPQSGQSGQNYLPNQWEVSATGGKSALRVGSLLVGAGWSRCVKMPRPAAVSGGAAVVCRVRAVSVRRPGRRRVSSQASTLEPPPGRQCDLSRVRDMLTIAPASGSWATLCFGLGAADARCSGRRWAPIIGRTAATARSGLPARCRWRCLRGRGSRQWSGCLRDRAA